MDKAPPLILLLAPTCMLLARRGSCPYTAAPGSMGIVEWFSTCVVILWGFVVSGHLWVFVRAFFDLQDSRRSNLHSCIRFKRLLHARNMTNVLSPQVTACAPGTQAGGPEPSASHHLRARYAGGRAGVRTQSLRARYASGRDGDCLHVSSWHCRELETVWTLHHGVAESLRLSAHFIMVLQSLQPEAIGTVHPCCVQCSLCFDGSTGAFWACPIGKL